MVPSSRERLTQAALSVQQQKPDPAGAPVAAGYVVTLVLAAVLLPGTLIQVLNTQSRHLTQEHR